MRGTPPTAADVARLIAASIERLVAPGPARHTSGPELEADVIGRLLCWEFARFVETGLVIQLWTAERRRIHTCRTGTLLRLADRAASTQAHTRAVVPLEELRARLRRLWANCQNPIHQIGAIETMEL